MGVCCPRDHLSFSLTGAIVSSGNVCVMYVVLTIVFVCCPWLVSIAWLGLVRVCKMRAVRVYETCLDYRYPTSIKLKCDVISCSSRTCNDTE